MGSALKVEPLISSTPVMPTAERAAGAAIRVVGRYELTDDEIEVLEFRWQGLQAGVNLDAMRMEELMRN
jgi:hypothetical protein